MRSEAIDTPCVKICQVNASRRICEGCGRTLAEIGGWLSMSATDRRRIMAELPARLASLSGAA
jgi:predicted Fe-S protein YdhL (DUF1289 family)